MWLRSLAIGQVGTSGGEEYRGKVRKEAGLQGKMKVVTKGGAEAEDGHMTSHLGLAPNSK